MTCWHYRDCIGGPGKLRVEQVELVMSLKKNKVEVATNDPGFKELIKRRAKLYTARCWGTFFYAELGTTGPMESKEVLRIRYTFLKRPQSSFMQLREYFEIRVKGDFVYPSHIALELQLP